MDPQEISRFFALGSNELDELDGGIPILGNLHISSYIYIDNYWYTI